MKQLKEAKIIYLGLFLAMFYATSHV